MKSKNYPKLFSKNGWQLRWRRALNKLRLRQKKIFAIGFNKSGTSSLHALFHELGRPSFHGVEWRSCEDMAIFHEYDCFSDGIPEDLPKLDRYFPDSKFILQVRELDGWIFSRLGHIAKEKRKGSHVATEYWDVTDSAVKTWILQRNRYHLDVMDYFSRRPEDLLIVNFIRDEGAATKICEFLGYSGTYSRPHVNINSRKTPPEEHLQILQRCKEELGLCDQDFLYDIYCPSLVQENRYLAYPKDTNELGQHSSRENYEKISM